MSQVNVEPAIVRIHFSQSQGFISGAGFLVDEKRCITCAHVVLRALGISKDMETPPEAEILLDFPLVAPKELLQARVIGWKKELDVAVLEISGKLPAGAQRARLIDDEDLCDHACQAFGFPQDFGAAGSWSNCKVVGQNAERWFQLQSDNVGFPIQQGFSGTPLWDKNLSSVVGMVVKVASPVELRTAYAFPVSMIAQAYPALRARLLPPVKPVEKPAWEGFKVKLDIQPREEFKLEENTYLVRQVVAKKTVHPQVVVSTFRVSDLTAGGDVGLRQVVYLKETADTKTGLEREVLRAQKFQRAAQQCEHLPQIRTIVLRQKEVLVLSEWIAGTPLDTFAEQSGALPDRSTLSQLVYAAVDVCAALSALHRERVQQAGVTLQTMRHMRGKRGTVLISTDFAGEPQLYDDIRFDASRDLGDLARALYTATAHRTPGAGAASQFNPVVPPSLGQTLEEAMGGKIQRAQDFKARLLAAKSEMQMR